MQMLEREFYVNQMTLIMMGFVVLRQQNLGIIIRLLRKLLEIINNRKVLAVAVEVSTEKYINIKRIFYKNVK
jgi:hypothetical protein